MKNILLENEKRSARGVLDPVEGETYEKWCARIGTTPAEMPGAPADWVWTCRPLVLEDCWAPPTDRRQPVEPEVGQVYARSALGFCAHFVLSRVDGDSLTFRSGVLNLAVVRSAAVFADMRLVGYELPGGERVLVGDVFQCTSERFGRWRVEEVLPAGCVRLRGLDGAADFPSADAAHVATGGWFRRESSPPLPARDQHWRGPVTHSRGHRVAMSPEAYERASLAFCADCGLRVKDRQSIVREGPCEPIRAGDRFASTTRPDMVITAERTDGLTWVLSGQRGSVRRLLPSELAGDVAGAEWRRLPRPEGRAAEPAMPPRKIEGMTMYSNGKQFDPERDRGGGAVIHKVEINAPTNQNPGQVARQVGAFLSSQESREPVTPPGEVYKYATGCRGRSEVDALLREDARLHPEFARARTAAACGYVDERESAGRGRTNLAAASVSLVLSTCLTYEGRRGGRPCPDPAARAWAEAQIGAPLVAAYEAARSVP